MANSAPKENGETLEPFIVSPGQTKNEKHSESSSSCNCCKCCTLKKCLIISAVIVVGVGLILAAGALRYYLKLSGTASSEDSDIWEERLQGDIKEVEHSSDRWSRGLIDGDFLLVSYGENYKNYLEALGIPSLVISLILNSKETVEYNAPIRKDGVWTRSDKTDLDEGKKVSFRMGEQYTETMGSRRIVYFNTTCQISGEKENVLTCYLNSTDGKFNIKSVAIFSKRGYIETRTLLGQNVSAKKYFSRESQLDGPHLHHHNSETDDELDIKIKEEKKKPTEKNPFSDSDDDFKDFDGRK